MPTVQARETARELLEIMPFVMRTVAAELRRPGRDAGAGAFRPADEAVRAAAHADGAGGALRRQRADDVEFGERAGASGLGAAERAGQGSARRRSSRSPRPVAPRSNESGARPKRGSPRRLPRSTPGHAGGCGPDWLSSAPSFTPTGRQEEHACTRLRSGSSSGSSAISSPSPASTSTCTRARSLASSGRTAPASRRRSTCCARCSGRRRARPSSTATTSAGARTASASRSASSSRTPASTIG